MAKQRLTQAQLNRVFSNGDIAAYSQLTTEIRTAQNQADGLAKTIAGALYVMQAKKLYEIESYKNIYEYAEMVHGISRGTCSDAINVFKRFGDKDNKRAILPEYANYAWRTLIMIKNLDDKTIGNLRITPELSSTEVKRRVQDFKEAEHLLPDNGEWTLEDMNKLLLDQQKQIEDKKGKNPDSTQSGNDDSKEPEPTNDPLSDIVNEEAAKDTLEKARAIMGDDAYEEMEAREGDGILEAAEDYIDEFMSFPKRTVDITDMSEKDAMAAIKALLKGVKDGEYDIIVTSR